MPARPPAWPRLAACVIAAAFALAVAQSVYRIPIQVSDSLDAILVSTHPASSMDLLQESSRWSSTTLRPMRYLQARWLSGLAEQTGMSHHAVFRGAHALLAMCIVGLVAWIADPRRWNDVAALTFTLTVLVGLHTFDAMMREAFPVNHYAEVAAAALFVLAVALRPPTPMYQAGTLVLLAALLLLIESAALVWVVIATCAILGLPGIQRRTAVGATLVLAAFLAARWMLDVGSPGIGGHSSGWGASFLSAEELETRFASNPWPLYLYNIVGGALSLLASEPRSGYYHLLAAREAGTFQAVLPLNLISSLLATAVVIVACRKTIMQGRRDWSTDSRILVVGAVVIIVSAALCANYIKDDIISTAGVFYAVMVYVATRLALDSFATTRVSVGAVALGASLVIASPLWAFRAIGTHYELRHTAFVSRNDWAMRSAQELAGGQSTGPDLSLTKRIRTEALNWRVTSPRFLPGWDRYFID